MKDRSMRLTLTGLICILSLSLISCAPIPAAPSDPAGSASGIEDVQRQLDELKKENEQMKEMMAALEKDKSDELPADDPDDPSAWTDDMVIEIDDANLEEAVREQFDIPEGDITYGKIKDKKALAVPGEKIGGEVYSLTPGRKDAWPEKIDSLRYFTGIEELELQVEDVADISVIWKMPSLRSLTLSQADQKKLSDIPECDIEEFKFRNYKGNNVDALKNMKNLKKIEYFESLYDENSYTSPIDFSALADLSHLEELDIRSNRVSIDFLKGLSSLKRFDFVNNKGKNMDYSVLSGMESIEDLFIMTDHVDLGFLPTLHNLKHLTIDTEDKDISGLKNLNNPDEIELIAGWVADDGNKYMYYSEYGTISTVNSTDFITQYDTTAENISVREFLDML